MKYICIKIDENRNCKRQIFYVAIKLNRSITILSKLRYFIDWKTMKSVYHGIFEPHLCYSSLVSAKHLNSIKRIFDLQKKSLRIIYFWSRNAHISPLFTETNILKLPDKIALENWLFINKYFYKFLPKTFKNWFTLSSGAHTYSTRLSNQGYLVVPPHNTKPYGRNSVNISVIYTWNYLQINWIQLSLRLLLKNSF